MIMDKECRSVLKDFDEESYIYWTHKVRQEKKKKEVERRLKKKSVT